MIRVEKMCSVYRVCNVGIVGRVDRMRRLGNFGRWTGGKLGVLCGVNRSADCTRLAEWVRWAVSAETIS